MSYLERCDLPAALAEAVQLGEIAEEHSLSSGVQRQALSDSIHSRLDTLISCLLTCCPEDHDVSVSEVRPVLDFHHDLTEASLADLDVRVVPLAIIRELVSRHKMVVHQDELPTWPRFVSRYRAVALA